MNRTASTYWKLVGDATYVVGVPPEAWWNASVALCTPSATSALPRRNAPPTMNCHYHAHSSPHTSDWCGSVQWKCCRGRHWQYRMGQWQRCREIDFCPATEPTVANPVMAALQTITTSPALKISDALGVLSSKVTDVVLPGAAFLPPDTTNHPQRSPTSRCRHCSMAHGTRCC